MRGIQLRGRAVPRRGYLGVHYPGDVVAGWSLAGIACAVGFAVAGVPF